VRRAYGFVAANLEAGTGNMAQTIATQLLACGHEVTLLGREAGKGEELARELRWAELEGWSGPRTPTGDRQWTIEISAYSASPAASGAPPSTGAS
jgi:glutamyl-tRNA reductase